ncbi:MAG: DegT/DnrJ/EryC1/StrS family aminotransferase, partial [Microthrixaceae bacterium]
FVASVNAALLVGAKVRFADIEPDTFNLDPAALDAVVNDRTKVVMPVHLYGQMADLDGIESALAGTDVRILEDAAQAHGATLGERRAGSVLGSFSFYATKNVSTGEGGAVTTDDDDLADRLRLLRNQGMRRRYEYEVVGFNYRMTDLQAAIGIPQMERLAEINATRAANAAHLTEGLSAIEGITPPVVAPGRGHVFHQYTVRITPDAAVTRDEAVDQLIERGIGCGIYYPRAAYDYGCYRTHPGVVIESCPEAERAAAETLSLPVHPHLTEAQLDEIVTTVTDVVRGR